MIAIASRTLAAARKLCERASFVSDTSRVRRANRERHASDTSRATRVWLIAAVMPLVSLLPIVAPADCATQASSASAPVAVTDLGGRLFRYVLYGGWEGGATVKADEERRLPEDVRARLRTFRARAKQVRSRLRRPPGGASDPERDGFFEKQATERALVALFDGPGVPAEAAAYAKDAPFVYEYEGHPELPRAEMTYARAFLKRHPNTRLAPYLWLILAHRSRVLFEIYIDSHDRERQRAAAAEYRDALEHARATDDPLLRAAIDDLDRAPYVYIPSKEVSATRPNTFR